MTFTVTNVRDNQSIPLALGETYLPDQLVYDLKFVVTQTVTISDTSILQRGTVLGMITEGTAGLVGTPVAQSGNTGNGVLSGISFGEEAKKGNYLVSFTGATTFTVTDPSGSNLGLVSSGHYGPKTGLSEIAFTFTAGTTPMISGDEIAIVAYGGTGNYWRTSKASLTDGSQVPTGILADICDPTHGPVTAPVYVAGEFNANAVIFDPSWSVGELTSVLSGRSIWLKTPVSAIDPTLPTGAPE